MKLADLIESCVDYHDVQIEKYYRGQEVFKENNIYVKGKSSYENYALVESLPKGTKFVVLIDEQSSNETGDFSWYFCIMVKYHDLYITLHDRG
ncbi:MAG: hypothetical protein ACI4VH_06905 [Clostridia bacterium]